MIKYHVLEYKEQTRAQLIRARDINRITVHNPKTLIELLIESKSIKPIKSEKQKEEKIKMELNKRMEWEEINNFGVFRSALE